MEKKTAKEYKQKSENIKKMYKRQMRYFYTMSGTGKRKSRKRWSGKRVEKGVERLAAEDMLKQFIRLPCLGKQQQESKSHVRNAKARAKGIV